MEINEPVKVEMFFVEILLYADNLSLQHLWLLNKAEGKIDISSGSNNSIVVVGFNQNHGKFYLHVY